MPRPSKIDRLPPAVREEIGRLRRDGLTIDDILDRLRGMVPESQQPSRAGLGRHIQKVDVLAGRIKAAEAMADRLVGEMGDGGEVKLARMNAVLLGTTLFDLLSGAEDGEVVVLEPKDAKALSETLRNIASAQKSSADYVQKANEIREEERLALEAEMKAKLDAIPAKKGVTPETLAEIRAALGIV
jgi:hypothetical protein